MNEGEEMHVEFSYLPARNRECPFELAIETCNLRTILLIDEKKWSVENIGKTTHAYRPVAGIYELADALHESFHKGFPSLIVRANSIIEKFLDNETEYQKSIMLRDTSGETFRITRISRLPSGNYLEIGQNLLFHRKKILLQNSLKAGECLSPVPIIDEHRHIPFIRVTAEEIYRIIQQRDWDVEVKHLDFLDTDNFLKNLYTVAKMEIGHR